MTVRASKGSPSAAATVKPRRTAAKRGGGRRKKKRSSALKRLLTAPLRRWRFTVLLFLFLLAGLLTSLDRLERCVSRLSGLRRVLPTAVADVILLPLELDDLKFPDGSELFGTAERVIDGDTFVFKAVDFNETNYKVRMWGVDAPESSQPFGAEARNALTEKLEGRAVRLVVATDDRYGRKVCRVFTSKGEDVNLYMVSQGLAWNWNGDYRSAEEIARKYKRGLWTEDAPQPPWEYRKAKRISGAEQHD